MLLLDLWDGSLDNYFCVKTSKTILKTAVSARKIAMYTTKIKNVISSTVVNAIRYIASAISNTLGSSGKKYLKELLGC